MKQSNSQIFNSSEKTQNNSLRTILTVKKNSSSTSKYRSRSLTCLNFPKLYSKIKYKRIGTDIQNKLFSPTSYINTERKPKLNIKTALKIYTYPKSRKKQISTNTKYFLPNIENNKISNHINFSKIHHFNFLNSLNRANFDYSSMFLSKRNNNNYTKYLSDSYRQNNKQIINMINTKYKEKNDSILNVVKKNDGFYIKGQKYISYFFYQHEKMDILSFHKKIMNENMQRFAKRKKIENLKIQQFKNRNLFEKRRSISNDDIFIPRAFNKRRTRKFFTKNFYTKKNLQNKIDNMIDYEINKVTVNKKNL